MIITATLIGSCAKDEVVIDTQPHHLDPIVNARFAFENKRRETVADNASNSPQKQGTLVWSEAITVQKAQTLYVFVPIRTDETYYAGEPGGRQHSVTARLRASNTGGKWVFDLILYIPEDKGWEASGKFTGTAIAEAWFGGRSSWQELNFVMINYNDHASIHFKTNTHRLRFWGYTRIHGTEEGKDTIRDARHAGQLGQAQ